MQQKELQKYLDIQKIYGNGYGGYNHARYHYDFLIKVLNVENCMTICDLGCGTGEFAEWVNKRFPQHYVIAVDPVFVEDGKSKTGVHYLRGDSTHIPIAKVDLLTSFDVMEHICEEDLEASFKEIARVTDYYITKIATFPSGFKGVNGADLHPIVKPLNWWKAQLGKYFKTVEEVNGLLICRK